MTSVFKAASFASKKIALIAVLALAAMAITATAAHANIVYNVLPYHAYSDTAQGANTISPFASTFGALTTQDPNSIAETTSVYDFRGLTAAPVPGSDYFFLEDFTDGQFDTPGATLSASLGMFTPRTDDGRNGSQSSSFTDNVDEDDGANDNSIGATRGSLRVNGAHNLRFTFDASTLGTLPTHVGIVLAEQNSGTLTAFDVNGNVLNTVSAMGVPGSFNPDLDNDAFLGIFSASGISYVEVTGGGNNEYDHFQFGALAVAVPEPSSLALFGLGSVMMLVRRRRG